MEIKEKNPIVYIDDRWLYADEGEVPEEIYEVPIGKGIIRKEGKDGKSSVSIVEVSTRSVVIRAGVCNIKSIKKFDKKKDKDTKALMVSALAVLKSIRKYNSDLLKSQGLNQKIVSSHEKEVEALAAKALKNKRKQ